MACRKLAAGERSPLTCRTVPLHRCVQAPKPQEPPGEWQFLQCFGERQEGEEVHDADVISAVEFNADGSYLATGDKGGRVVLFEKIASQAVSSAAATWFEFKYLTEFQSHEPEFDYLKSVEIEEGLNQIKWVRSSSGAKHILSTNDKTIKLWKVYDKQTHIVTGWNVDRPGSMAVAPSLFGGMGIAQPYTRGRLRIPTVVPQREVRMVSRAKRIFSNAHTYHINSVGVSSDHATFLSADDLRINLWSLEVPDRCFNMVDIKPSNMEELSEVITCADFHPMHCSLFAYSSSKGCIRLGDLRSAALCDRSAKTYQEKAPEAGRSFFSEIIASTSSLRFSGCGRYMLSRDFMSLKLWDLAMEGRPVATLQVHEEVRPRLCDLYENDCIFDKFGCCMNGPGTCFASGTYSNRFKVFDCNSVMQQQPPQEYALQWPIAPAGTALEASRDPMRRRLQLQPASSAVGAPGVMAEQQQQPEGQLDCSSKLLHLAWHPKANVIACAAANSLYLYCA
ncbi:WD40-repeat-containing domain protein [Scenedesmus sp. NREL 46B-D3]|nr:WD40-repeat-containing domain protein [Scenedesmus sp. NREL 46B-D3]